MGTTFQPAITQENVLRYAENALHRQLIEGNFDITDSRHIPVPLPDDGDQTLANIARAFSAVMKSRFPVLHVSRTVGPGDKWQYPSWSPETENFALRIDRGDGYSYSSVWGPTGSLRVHSVVVSIAPNSQHNTIGVVLKRPQADPFLISTAIVTLNRLNQMSFYLTAAQVRIREIADAIFRPLPRDAARAKDQEAMNLPQWEPVYIDDYQLRQLRRDVDTVLFPRAEQTFRAEFATLPVFLQEMAGHFEQLMQDAQIGRDLD
jgi:hypothetical protein